jgi:Holliday junction resolvase-like predicted endonuclease
MSSSSGILKFPPDTGRTGAADARSFVIEKLDYKIVSGLEQVSRSKFQRLQSSAQQYLADNDRESTDWQIDLLSVDMDRTGRVLGIEHIPSAIEEQG